MAYGESGGVNSVNAVIEGISKFVKSISNDVNTRGLGAGFGIHGFMFFFVAIIFVFGFIGFI